jgi:hypothetical protein
MTISPAVNPVMAHRAAAANAPPPQRETANGADEAMIRQRFAGMLGLDPDQLTSPVGAAAAPKASEAPRQYAAASAVSGARQLPTLPAVGLSATATLPVPAPTTVLTMDEPGTTVSAGTIMNGMVSAGPMSPGMASMSGGVPASTGTHLIAVATDAQKFNYDPIAMIRDRLTKLGVNPAGMQFERWVDTINGPGGQRVNQYVRGTFGGITENFAVERVLQNPDITAVEIQSLLARAT